MGKITNFNADWQFALDGDNWKNVEIPHDWLIADPKNWYKSGLGCYKKTFKKPEMPIGGQVLLRFDGVYMDSALYVNGEFAGEWKYGYTSFEHDITPFLKDENEILLKVNYQAPNSRWYTGAGIYRDCYLVINHGACFLTDGIYITPKKESKDLWRVEISAEISKKAEGLTLNHCIIGEGEIDGLTIKNPRIWDIFDPYLYIMRSEIIDNGKILDIVETRFGLREIAFTTNEGFYLNGRRVRLNGVCLHHDLGSFGAAFNKGAAYRQLKIMREMGINAIRCAHNPAASKFMDLCDEMGFLVMTEITDIWALPKNEFDYSRFFNDWIERDMAAFIRRDYNRPCIIMYSVGNEIYDTHADEGGQIILNRLLSLIKKHDPKQHAYATLCSNYMPWENTQKCADIIKLIGYNYGDTLYKQHHDLHPDWIIYGSETCSTAQSRGVYKFPLSQSVLSDDDMQCSALGNCATSWGAKNVETCIIADRDTPFSLGQFIWSGFDYLGEPTPYHTKNAYLGHVDTAGFPKDSYYVFKAAFTDKPMIHLYPYWDWSHGQIIDVRAATNAYSVELFLNGISYGKKILDGGYIADWQLPYEAGEIEAIAFDTIGNIVAAMSHKSFGDATDFIIKEEIFDDLCFFEIIAADSQGLIVENANRRVNVEVTGGRLLTLDNGDACDDEPYQNNNRRFFNGRLLAIVEPKPHKSPELILSYDEADIPIRKIELTVKDDYLITAEIFPKNATHRDLTWRLTNAAGVDSPLGDIVISKDLLSCKIQPKGDGRVFIRAMAGNGASHPSIISAIPLELKGFGTPCLNPYEFISAGLFSDSFGVLTNGNERGAATARDGVSAIGFDALDFGEIGADELTLWIFALDKAPFSFELWEGSPDSGKMLSALEYVKGSIWNTYQPQTFTLPKKLKGIVSLWMVFRQKVHIKGFSFTKPNRACKPLYAAFSDGVYGDSFKINGNVIEGIGNNVSIIYEALDFGENSVNNVEIKWRGIAAKSPLSLIWNGSKQIIDLDKGDWGVRQFKLTEPLAGNGRLSLLFLPGSELDLEWIKFLRNSLD